MKERDQGTCKDNMESWLFYKAEDRTTHTFCNLVPALQISLLGEKNSLMGGLGRLLGHMKLTKKFSEDYNGPHQRFHELPKILGVKDNLECCDCHKLWTCDTTFTRCHSCSGDYFFYSTAWVTNNYKSINNKSNMLM